MPEPPQIAKDAESPAPTFKPVRLVEVDIAQPLAPISANDPRTGQRYERALLLVRLHHQPLGVVLLDSPAPDWKPEALVNAIWPALSPQINDHLRQDRLPEIDEFNTKGLPQSTTPFCAEERAKAAANSPFISIVVCTRDRTDQLALSIQALTQLDYERYEIIVVDNARQNAASEDLIKNHFGHVTNLRYVEEKVSGLSNARNCGLRYAKGEIVAYTDDDAQTDPHWLIELAIGFQQGPQVACVTGLILPAEIETPAQAWFEQGGGFNKGFVWRTFDLTENRPTDRLFPYSAGTYGSGVNMAFRMSALNEIGGFDPIVGPGTPAMNGDDLTAFVAVILRGYQIVYNPGAVVYHTHRREYRALRQQMYSYGVGLAAVLTKWAIEDPLWIFKIGAKIPLAIRHVLSAQSPKNRNKSSDYPSELTRLERRGLFDGPMAYLKSRWQARR